MAATEKGFITVLKIMNRLKAEGIVSDYAIGGGIATLRYTEPFFTQDLDLFVVVKQQTKLVLLMPIYDRFGELGYQWSGEHLIVEGLPVQFIAADALEEEAVKNAAPTRLLGVTTKIFTPEYLIAILVRAGRDKDKIKVAMLLKQTKVNRELLDSILARFRLVSKFKRLIR